MLTLRGGDGGRDYECNMQQETVRDRPSAGLRGGWVVLADGSDAGRRRQEGSGKARNRGESTAELVFPRPALGKMQGEAPGLAGEPSGQGEEASLEGFGGDHLLAQTNAPSPAGQQLCWLSRRIGNFCRTRTTPSRVIFDHGVQDGEQFTHASDQGHFLRLTGRQQPLLEVSIAS